MRTWIFRIRIAKGSNSIDLARSSRASEAYKIGQVLRLLREELDKVARGRKSQPYVIIHLSEGATSLSVAEMWVPRMLDEIAARGGYAIIMLNIGKNIRALKEDEYQKRMEVIRMILRSKELPVIITTNCIRTGNSIIFDEDSFDPKYALLAYAIDRCAIGRPMRDDLSNLLQPGTVHTVTTPVRAWNYSDFMKTHVSGVSFMFTGDLGTGRSAPLLLEAKERVNGMIIVGFSEEYLGEVMYGFSKDWPGRLMAVYALRPAKEESSRLFPLLRHMPRVRDLEAPKGWSKESFLVTFTANITPEEAEKAIETARTISPPSEKRKAAEERPRATT